MTEGVSLRSPVDDEPWLYPGPPEDAANDAAFPVIESRPRRFIPFTDFCRRVLKLDLTLGQYALAHACFDPPGSEWSPQAELMAQLMFGGADFKNFPVEALAMVVLRCGRGGGKSTIAAAYILYRMLTADCSQCGPGDDPTFLLVGPLLDHAKDTLKKAKELAANCNAIERLMPKVLAESFEIRRPDGVTVRCTAIAKSAGGASGRGKSILGMIVDESEFLPTRDTGAVRDRDIVEGVVPRLMQDGVIVLASTPWPGDSMTKDEFRRSYGHPNYSIACKAPTLLLRDTEQNRARYEARKARSPQDAAREFDCEDVDASGYYFEASSIDRARSLSDLKRTSGRTSCGVDLAFLSDGCAQIIVERQTVTDGQRLAVVSLDLFKPSPGQPLQPSAILATFALRALENGCRVIVGDHHYAASLREAALVHGLQVATGPGSPSDSDAAFQHVRDLFRESMLAIGPVGDPDSDALAEQLKSVLYSHEPTGRIKPVLPRVAGEGHCDLVSALVLAVWWDRMRHGPLRRKGSKVEAPIGFIKREG
jgi:hypothetical protein